MGLKMPWSERAEPIGLEIDISVPAIGRRYSTTLGLSHKLSICINCAVASFVGGIAIGLFANSYGTTLNPAFIAVFLIVVGALVFLVTYPIAVATFNRGIREIKGQLLSKRCQVCVHCFYDLSARPRDIDTCPECGLNAPRRECVRLWCKLLRSRF